MNGTRANRVRLSLVIVTLVLLHFYVRPRVFDAEVAPDFLFFALVTPEFIHLVEDLLRPALFRDGTWMVDYRRLRIVAIK